MRYLTTDALNNNDTIHFYENNDFQYLTKDDKENETRYMYYDLINSKEYQS